MEGETLRNGSMKSHPNANGTVLTLGPKEPVYLKLMNGKGPVGPNTPSLNGTDNRDSDDLLSSMTDCIKSPTATNGHNHVVVGGGGGCISPCTPKQALFDPFAPGPDELALAPICRKFVHMSKTIRARRLDFEEDSDVHMLSEEMVIESVHNLLFEVIVSTLTDDFHAESNGGCSEANGSAGTPGSSPLLTGVAGTCPDAPMKTMPKSMPRNTVPAGLSRKLEF